MQRTVGHCIIKPVKLTHGFQVLALKLQEIATTLSDTDIRTRVGASIKSHYDEMNEDGQYHYAYLVDVFGDASSGQAVYSVDGQLRRANYKMRTTGEKATCDVDCEGSEEVVPTTQYKRLEADRTDKESLQVQISGEFVSLKEGSVGQDGTAYLKLIAPGWGSSGYYPAEVLERDGPKVFANGTKNFWNHQTDAEEAARPEGDLRDLASVLTEDSHYEKNGPAGPGLYAKAKVFEEFRQPVDDLAKHIGMSIRATGKAKEGTAEGKTGAIIEQLTRGISVDYVTTPGAGGKILQLFEAARAVKTTEKEGADEMDAAELKKLQESIAQTQADNAVIKAENRKLRERMALSDAATEVRKILGGIRISEAISTRVASRILAGVIPLTEVGDLDLVKLKTLVEGEAKDECEYVAKLSGGQIVTGMGSGAAEMTEAQKTEHEKELDAEARGFAEGLGLQSKQAIDIMTRGRSAFRPMFNAADGRGTESD